jgi:hypothetical protein
MYPEELNRREAMAQAASRSLASTDRPAPPTDILPARVLEVISRVVVAHQSLDRVADTLFGTQPCAMDEGIHLGLSDRRSLVELLDHLSFEVNRLEGVIARF